MSRELRQAGTHAPLSGPVRLPRRVDERVCQQGVDIKAFTGRGRILPSVARCRMLVDRVHRAMASLASQSRLPAGGIHLCVHRRNLTGQVSLRWRHAGRPGAHIGWTELKEWIDCSPDRDWYARLNAAALELNFQEKDARQSLRQAEARQG